MGKGDAVLAVEATGRGLVAARDFLVCLSSAPTPETVAAALAAPGLLPLRIASTSIWVVTDRHLTRIAAYDSPDTTRPARPLVDEISLTSSDPAARACSSTSIIRSQSPVAGAPVRLRVPIVARGLVIGVYGADGEADGPFTTDDIEILDAVADATALWLGHRVPTPSGSPAPQALSRRQQQILVLVLAGSTNAAIAASLGCSIATVKLELLTVNRLLGTTERRGAARIAFELGLLAPDDVR